MSTGSKPLNLIFVNSLKEPIHARKSFVDKIFG